MASTQKKVVQNPIKTGEIKNLIVHQFCPENVDRKLRIINELRETYVNYKVINDVTNLTKQLADVSGDLSFEKNQLRKLTTNLKKLSTFTRTKLRTIANEYNIVGNKSLDDDELRALLISKTEDKIKICESEIVKLEKAKKTVNAKLKAETSVISEFYKTQKKEFGEWKSSHMPDNKAELKELRTQRKSLKKKLPDGSDDLEYDDRYREFSEKIKILENVYPHLFAQLETSGLSDMQRDTYRLRLQKDELSTQMVRFADSARVLGAYIREMLRNMVDGLATANAERHKQLVAKNTTSKQLPPTPVELEDIKYRYCRMSAIFSAYCTLYKITETEPISELTPEYGIVGIVRRYLDTRKKCGDIPITSPEVVNVLSRTVIQYVRHMATLIKNHLEKTGTHTIKKNLIFTIMEPYYVFSGESHPQPIPKPKKVVQ